LAWTDEKSSPWLLGIFGKNPGLQLDDSIVLEGISEERINLLTSIGFVWEPSPYINIIPTRTTLEKRKRLMEWQAAHEKECEEYNAKQRRRQFSTVEDVHNRRNQLEAKGLLSLHLPLLHTLPTCGRYPWSE
jgi:hypothetical protein